MKKCLWLDESNFLSSLICSSYSRAVLILREPPQSDCDFIKTPFTDRKCQRRVDKRRISPTSPPVPIQTGQGLWGRQCIYCGRECLNSHLTRQQADAVHVDAPTHIQKQCHLKSFVFYFYCNHRNSVEIKLLLVSRVFSEVLFIQSLRWH